jgi:CBS domain-containing protein
MESIKKLKPTNTMNYDEFSDRKNTLHRFIKRNLVWITPEATVKEAAKLMHRENVSSIVVIKNEIPLGIITDSDLRRLIADGYDMERSLDDVLRQKFKRQPSLITVDVNESIHEALSKMLEHRIKHTVVMEAGKPKGVVTIGDIAYRLSPFYVYYAIRLRKAKKIGEIKEILDEFKDEIIRYALKFAEKPEEGRTGFFFETISYVVDTALRSLVEITGEVPENLVYAATGSWGRREQFILTDRDTIAIYQEEKEKDEFDSLIDEIDVRSFIEEIEDCMDEVGFPPCPHGYTSRNLCFRTDELIEHIDRWCGDAEKYAVNISIIADSRPLLGNSAILERIKRRLIDKMRRNRFFVSQSLIYKPPLSLLGISKSFDFKSRAVAPLEYPIRALAITNGVLSLSTPERIKTLGERGIISSEMSHDLLYAYNIIMKLKIMLQARFEEELELSTLSAIERKMLEDALKTVKLFQDYTEKNFT